MTTFTDPHGDASAYEHNPLGQVILIQHPNGTRAELGHDDDGRLLDLVNRGPGDVVQSAYHYMLDRVGNRVQTVEKRAPFNGLGANVVLAHNYEYDALDRLVRAATDDPASDTAYAFDAVGNRLNKIGTVLSPDAGVPELPVAPRPEETAYTYNAANQMLTADDTAFDYNDNGDRVRETEVLTGDTTLLTDYAYDREGRLVGVTKSVSDSAAITVTMVATYTYDGYGRRAIKQVTYPGGITPTQVITYLYDGLDIVGAQLAVSGIVTETYYYLAPSPVTGLRRSLEMERLPNPATGFAGDRHWYQNDGLDSVVALINESGDLASPYLYDEYGQMLAGTTELQVFAYTAQDYDPETELYHFYARYYDPARGVWLTLDLWKGRSQDPDSQHRYGYVSANPVRWFDILGYSRVGTCPESVSIDLWKWISGALRGLIAGTECEAEGACAIHPVVKFIAAEMRKNAVSQEIEDIRSLNETHYYEDAWEEYQKMPWWLKIFIGPEYFESALQADMASRLAALTQFGCLVADARTRPVCGQWDYKADINKKWGAAQRIDFCSIGHNEEVIFYYDIWANIHFGYIGIAGGFLEDDLLTGAALEHAISNPGQFRDDPSDQASAKIGIDLYKQYGTGVTEEAVLMQVYIHKSELNKARVEDGQIIEVYR